MRLSLLLTVFAAFLLTAQAARAEAQAKSEIVITRQPGILHLPLHVMEKQGLVEKHAARLGLPGLKVRWKPFEGVSSKANELLSGAVDIYGGGSGNLLLLWDRTKGGVQAIAAISALPVMLISRNPNIRSLQDFGPADKIAAPTLKVSMQALMLQMACAKLFGENEWNRLERNVVQLRHADAAAAIANEQSGIASHFSAPLWQFEELKTVPGAHVVVTSTEIMGGPLTIVSLLTTTRFAEANPIAVEAVKAAAIEAEQAIHADTRAAVEIYREVTGDKTATDEILDMLKQPGMMEFNPQPEGLMKLAEHMHRTGILKTKPQAWTDIFLPVAHDLPGS